MGPLPAPALPGSRSRWSSACSQETGLFWGIHLCTECSSCVLAILLDFGCSWGIQGIPVIYQVLLCYNGYSSPVLDILILHCVPLSSAGTGSSFTQCRAGLLLCSLGAQALPSCVRLVVAPAALLTATCDAFRFLCAARWSVPRFFLACSRLVSSEHVELRNLSHQLLCCGMSQRGSVSVAANKADSKPWSRLSSKIDGKGLQHKDGTKWETMKK